MFELSRAMRTDLPTSLEGYFNLPRWYAPRRGGPAPAADELVTQLDLITASLTKTAEAVYDADTRRMRDHTRYLRDREPDDSLGLPPTADQPAVRAVTPAVLVVYVIGRPATGARNSADRGGVDDYARVPLFRDQVAFDVGGGSGWVDLDPRVGQ
jgi:hypothetical protein